MTVYMICVLWFVVGFCAGMGMWIIQGGPILRKDVAVAVGCGVFAPLAVIGMIVVWFDTRDWWEQPVWNRPERRSQRR